MINNLLIVIVVLCVLTYIFLLIRNKKLEVNEIESFGDEETVELLDVIVKQKILHKSISFYAYIVCLLVSFALGSWIIYKIINNEINWKLLKDAIGISAGTLATVNLKRLHDKCAKELESLARVQARR